MKCLKSRSSQVSSATRRNYVSCPDSYRTHLLFTIFQKLPDSYQAHLLFLILKKKKFQHRLFLKKSSLTYLDFTVRITLTYFFPKVEANILIYNLFQ